jgi:hypothetical protein
MSCMSSRAMHISCSRVEMSRDSALVMFFYMRLEKHVCNAMSIDLLFALSVVSFDHLQIHHIRPTYVVIHMVRIRVVVPRSQSNGEMERAAGGETEPESRCELLKIITST